jgi:SAM-dependent methyltransferase
MTPFELVYLCAEPFLPSLYRQVRRRLKTAADDAQAEPETLDVGGRKSHYTIGVPGRVTISELPRVTDLQSQLNLGMTARISEQLRRRRSNVREVCLDDMTRSSLPDSRFDCVVAVEVLEHVEEDRLFLGNVRRVLKPGGVFLMTTPNGDHIATPTNPDHKRHYTREELSSLLASFFAPVEVEYAIEGGRFHSLGLKSWSVKHPVRTALSMLGNAVNAVQSSRPSIKQQSIGTQHLIATAGKPMVV